MSIFHSLFNHIAMFFVSLEGSYIFSAFIISIGMITYFFFFRKKVKSFVKMFSSACDELMLINGAQAFCLQFDVFDKRMRGDKWLAFKQALIFPKPGDPIQEISYTDPPDAYFSQRTLLAPEMDMRMLSSIPGILTGLGLLGTFLGLISGIALTGTHLDSQKVSVAKQSLDLLLSGAATAFMTSIAGITSSLLYSIYHKRWLRRFDMTCLRWNSALRSRMRQVTLEETVFHLNLEAKKHTELLEKLVNTSPQAQPHA